MTETVDFDVTAAGSKPPNIVPRPNELEAIEAEIKRRIQEPIVVKSIIVIYGTAGLGKSTFVDHSLIPLLKTEYPTLPWVKIDFDRDVPETDSRYDCRPGRGRLIIDLVRGLTGSIGEEPSAEFNRIAKRWQDADVGWSRCKATSPKAAQALAEAEEELVGDFNLRVIPSLINRDNRRPVVIVMDTVEEIGDQFMSWIQTSLQAPTVKYGYVLWVMAGRFFIENKTYSLARSFYQLRLPPFDVDQIGQQLPEQSDLAPLIQQLSHGLPAAAEQIARTVREMESKEARELSAADLEVEDRKQQLIDSLETYLMDKQNKVLSGLDEVQIASLRLLSLLRLINFSILTQLLPYFLRQYLKRDVVADAETIMQKLQAARLVDWNRERRGYSVEEPLRRILADILTHTHRDIFDGIHRQAFDLFDDWYQNVPEKRRDYLIEAIYHRAVILFKLDEPSEPSDDYLQLRDLLADAIDRFAAGGERRQRVTEKRRELLIEVLYDRAAAILKSEERADAFAQLQGMLADAIDSFYIINGAPDRDALDELGRRLNEDMDLDALLSDQEKEALLEVVRKQRINSQAD